MNTTTTTPTFMDKVEAFLQSSAGLFLSLIMVLAFSTPNTTEVLVKINRLDIENVRMLALCFAIVIEFIILILAAIGQDKAAKYYAIASFAFHTIYYHRWDEVLMADFNDKLLTSQVITNLVASVLTSFMIAASIHYFSKQIKIKIEEKKALRQIVDTKQENENLLNQNAELLKQREELQAVLITLDQTIAQNQSLNAEIEKVIAKAMQDKALIQTELLDKMEIVEACNEKIRSIKKIKAALSRGAMNDEISALLNQITPE